MSIFRILRCNTNNFVAFLGSSRKLTPNVAKIVSSYNAQTRNISTVLTPNLYRNYENTLLSNSKVLAIAQNVTSRNVTKFSLRKGKRKSVKVVLQKFYRLNWGGWIRTKCGRHKSLWKKSYARKRRLRQHVFCNATQCTLLDKMVTRFWKRPKHYVDDPYKPYHSRREFPFATNAPRPYFPKNP